MDGSDIERLFAPPSVGIGDLVRGNVVGVRRNDLLEVRVGELRQSVVGRVAVGIGLQRWRREGIDDGDRDALPVWLDLVEAVGGLDLLRRVAADQPGNVRAVGAGCRAENGALLAEIGIAIGRGKACGHRRRRDGGHRGPFGCRGRCDELTSRRRVMVGRAQRGRVVQALDVEDLAGQRGRQRGLAIIRAQGLALVEVEALADVERLAQLAHRGRRGHEHALRSDLDILHAGRGEQFLHCGDVGRVWSVAVRELARSQVLAVGLAVRVRDLRHEPLQGRRILHREVHRDLHRQIIGRRSDERRARVPWGHVAPARDRCRRAPRGAEAGDHGREHGGIHQSGLCLFLHEKSPLWLVWQRCLNLDR